MREPFGISMKQRSAVTSARLPGVRLFVMTNGSRHRATGSNCWPTTSRRAGAHPTTIGSCARPGSRPRPDPHGQPARGLHHPPGGRRAAPPRPAGRAPALVGRLRPAAQGPGRRAGRVRALRRDAAGVGPGPARRAALLRRPLHRRVHGRALPPRDRDRARAPVGPLPRGPLQRPDPAGDGRARAGLRHAGRAADRGPPRDAARGAPARVLPVQALLRGLRQGRHRGDGL